MENSDFLVLNNESDLVFFKEITPIKIIGFDTTNLNLENLKNEEYFSICMLHNPDKINNLKDVKCDLALAGDTLGGEIKVTPNSCLLTDNKYCKSYYDINNTKLYISNGIGNNYKVRLFNRPSINLYRLRKY